MASGVWRLGRFAPRRTHPGLIRGARGAQGCGQFEKGSHPANPHYYLRIPTYGVRGVRTNTERVHGRARACSEGRTAGVTRGRTYGGEFYRWGFAPRPVPCDRERSW